MNSSNISIIIQARTNSNRLPNKVLAKIENKPMIWYVVNRVKKVKKVKQIVLCTTNLQNDQKLIDIAEENEILNFKGSTEDVLDRYYRCALEINADPIIRITGDCPLIDPLIIDDILEFFLNNNYDYVSNTILPTYPDGLDVEIFSFNALENAATNAKLKSEREHVTPFFKNHPEIFNLFNFKNDTDLSHLRWTVDEKEDLIFAKKIFHEFKPKIDFSTQEILKLLKHKPELLKINSKIKRNEGYLKSLKDYNETK